MADKPIIAFIFARGGSKGLAKKNILPLGGVPLIARAIECAKQVKSIDRIIVSTDDNEISDVALSYGAEVPFRRPTELSSDTAAEWHAWQHAIEWAKGNGGIGTFLSLPATSPLRSNQDVEMCLEAFNRGDLDMVVTVRQAARSPYFNMVSQNSSGGVDLASSIGENYVRRQDVPEVFDMTTVAYVAKPDFILKENSIFDGNVVAVEIPRGRAVDIDDHYDMVEAEAYLSNNLLNGDPKIL